MKDEQTTGSESLLKLDGPREHRKDGAGTRETNPLYCGSYTLNDYTRDRDSGVMKPETVEFERILLSGFRKNYPEEAERFDRLYGEARKAYNGPTEWEHGYKLNDISHCDQATCWSYFKSYYELTDAEAIEAIKEALEENRDLLSFADEIHPLLLEAVEKSDWLQILEERERIRAIERPGYVPEIPTADEFTRDIITRYIRTYLEGWVPDSPIEDGKEQGADEQPDSPEDPFDEPRLAAKAMLGFALWARRTELEAAKEKLTAQGKTNRRLEELEAEGYGPLIEYVRANYTEDRARRFRISDLGIYTLYVLMEYKALAGSPPETITADTEALLEQAYQRIEGNTIHYLTLEGQRETGESDTEDIDNLALASSVPSFKPENQIDPDKGLVVLRNESDRKLIRDPISGHGLNGYNLVRRNPRESVQAKISTVNGARGPTELDIDLTIQIGLYLGDMTKKGQEWIPISAEDLIHLFYGIPDDKRIKADRIQEMESRLENLTGVWVTIDRDDIQGNPEDWGEAFKDLIGGRVQLLEYDELHFKTAHRKKTNKYLFRRIPPIWVLTEWHQLYQQTPMLIRTPDYSFEGEEWNNLDIPRDIRDRIIKHYEDEGLQMRRKDRGLQLQPYDTLEIKKWILRLLAQKTSITRQLDPSIIEKMPHTITVEMRKAYGEMYPDVEIPGERTTKWTQFTVDFRTYLLYLMAWGYVEDYSYTGTKTNPKIVKITYTEKTRVEIAGVRNGVAQLR